MLLGLIALATVVAVWLHARKVSSIREETDDIAYALQGIGRHFSEGQTLNLRLPGVKSELFLHARLALVPRHVTLIRENEPADTLLLITAREAVDTLSAHAQIIWSDSDDHYRYQLLSFR